MRKRPDDLQHGAPRRRDDVICDFLESVHGELVHQLPQPPAAHVIAGGKRVEIADDLDRFPDVGPDDLEHALVGFAAIEEAHDRNAQALLVDLARIGTETGAPDVDDMHRRGKEPHRGAFAKTRSHDREVEEVPGAVPGIVGDEDITLLHGGDRILLEEETDRRRHGIDVAGCPGDCLGKHAALEVEYARRQVAGFAHGRRKGRADDRLRLFLDGGNEPVPQHLVAQSRHQVRSDLAAMLEHEVSVFIEGAPPTGRHDGRGLGLDNRRGTGHPLSRGERMTRENSGPARVVVAREDNSTERPCAVPGGRRRRHPAGGRMGDTRHGRQRPGQHLDLEPRNRSAELLAIGALEGIGDPTCVPVGERPVRKIDPDLVTLSDVASESVAMLFHGLTRRTPCHHVVRLPAHGVEEHIESGGIEAGKTLVVAPHHLVGHRSKQQPDGRSDAGVDRNDDLADAQFLGDAQCVHGRCSAEGDHGAILDLLAAFDRMHAGRCRHVLVYDLDDAQRRLDGSLRQRLAHATQDRLGRGSRVEIEGASGEVRRVETAQDEIGIGDRGIGAALAIACRPGFGAGALRAHLDPSQLVDGGDGSPAGTDLHHFHDGNLEGYAASLHEAMGPVDLEMAPQKRFAVIEQADLRRRAPHVEADDLVIPHGPRDVTGQNRPSRGARLDEPYRVRPRRRNRDEAAARGHEEERTGESRLLEGVFHVGEVGGHDGLDVGVRHGCRLTLVFPDFGTHIARDGDRHVGQPFGDHGGNAPFMLRIGVGMKQTDSHTFHTEFTKAINPGRNGLFIERHQYLAPGVDPFWHRESEAPRHQGSRAIGQDVVLIKTVLVGDLQGVPVALGDEERRAGSLAFDQGVGRQGRAVKDETDVTGHGAGSLHHLHETGHESLGGRCRRQGLGGMADTVAFQHHVREGPADVDADAYAACQSVRPVFRHTVIHT